MDLALALILRAPAMLREKLRKHTSYHLDGDGILFAENNCDRLPVVEDRASARLIGYLDKQDLLTAYHRVLTKTL